MSNKIEEILDVSRFDDAVWTDGGLLAKKRPDVGSHAYEVSIYPPLTEEEIASIARSRPEVKFEFLQDLYSICNGLHIGFGGFSVYGIQKSTGMGFPFDLNDPNFYEVPQGLPLEDLVVGTSRRGGRRKYYYHVFSSSGVIRISPKEDLLRVSVEYASVKDWLRQEIENVLWRAS